MMKPVFASAVLALLSFSVGVRAQMVVDAKPLQETRKIQVQGTGTVSAEPDMAVITIGVTTDDMEAPGALAKNNAATAKVLTEMEGAGIDRKDLRTSNFSIFPQYPTSRDGQTATQRPSGYRVSNTVIVTIRAIAKVGDVLTKAVGAGSNQISGLRFVVSDPEKYLNEARKAAVENAMAKASLIASAAGVKLGSILAISDTTSSGVSPVPVFRAVAMQAAVPIEGGEQTLQAQVHLEVEITQP